MCLAPHPTKTYGCTKRAGHYGRYHTCFLTDFGAFGDQPKEVFLRWKKSAPVDFNSPERQRARSLVMPGTPESRARFAESLVRSALAKRDDPTPSSATPDQPSI